MNGVRLLEEARNRLTRNDESGRGVSHCDLEFLVAVSSRFNCITAVEFQRFAQRDA